MIDEKILLLRDKLEKLITVTENLNNDEVIYLSQELDKLICEYYKYIHNDIKEFGILRFEIEEINGIRGFEAL